MKKQKIEIEIKIPKVIEEKKFKATGEFRPALYGEFFVEPEFLEVCFWDSSLHESLSNYIILKEAE